MKTALITGITGQDGSYLAELLLSKGYKVYGSLRRSSSFNTGRIDHIFNELHLEYADLTDSNSLNRLIDISMPDEVYNLAGQSHVRTSIDIPEYTANVNSLGTLRLLEAINKFSGTIRFYQASSSEMFGSSPAPQNEQTPFHPCSPYGISKVFSYFTTINYRETHRFHASNGILFNHESPRRGETFVTRKICKAAVRIKAGLQSELRLGNLDAERDWGYAPEYVEAMHLMLQQDKPGDYIIATGETHTVEEFVDAAFQYVGLDWHDYIIIDARLYRPVEVDELQGDARKAKRLLNWEPKVKFNQLVEIMMEHELEKL